MASVSDPATTPVAQFIAPCAPQVRLYPESDPDYQHAPCSCDWFLNQVQLVEASMASGPPVTTLPDTPSTPTPHLQMPGATWQDNLTIRQGNQASAVAYVHTLPVAEYPGLWDLQYWLFFPIRGFSTLRLQFDGSEHTFDLTTSNEPYQGMGEHQGDWKHVTVRIDEGGAIHAVYYAQHTGGFWCFRGDYETVPGGDGNEHPVVYSARNTHSCFPGTVHTDQIGTVHGFLDLCTFSLLEETSDAGSDFYWNLWEGNQPVNADTTAPSWWQYAGQWGPTFNQADDFKNVLEAAIGGLSWVTGAVIAAIAEVLVQYIKYDQSGPSSPFWQDPPYNRGDAGYGWASVQYETAYSEPGGPVTAIYQPQSSDERLDLFICGTNGHVYTIGRSVGSGWDAAWSTVDDTAYSMGGGLVTAAYQPSAQPPRLDLFIYGKNGYVYTIGRTVGSDWDPRWTPVQSPFGGASGHHMPITAVYQPGASPDHLDLFCADERGSIRTIGWTDGSGWDTTWSAPIARGSGYSTEGGPVTAIWRPDTPRLDLFMCGQNGTVYTIGRPAGGEWDPGWTQISPGTGRSTGGGPIAAAYRPGANPVELSLFMGGKNDQVYTITWTPSVSWASLSWTELTDTDFTGFLENALHVSAVWRDASHLDIFCAGALSGAVYAREWTSDAGTWGSWTPFSPSTGYTEPGSQITAVSQDPTCEDLFMCGDRGWVYRARLYPTS